MWWQALGQVKEEELEEDTVADRKSFPELRLPQLARLEEMFFTLHIKHKIESLIAHCHLSLQTLVVRAKMLAGFPPSSPDFS